MARDGSGNFSRAVTPPSNGDIANVDDYNTEQNDVAQALSDSINKAGTKAFAANQSMGGFKLTNLGAPTAGGDATNKTYVDGLGSTTYQPLDATLTALATLSWSSSNALVQFTAADTVSLTLTPSVTTLTTNSTTASTAAVTAKNSTDNASVQGLVIQGARATPSSNDVVYQSWLMNNASSAAKEFARISALGPTLTAGAEVGRLKLSAISAGTLTDLVLLSSSALYPFANDGIPLGLAVNSWSDLFLASGGVLNWNNGNATLTHSAGLLASNVPVQAAMPASSETSGTLTSASRNKVVSASGGITIDGNVFTAGDMLCIYAGASSRTLTQGSTGSPTQRLNGTATTGNLTLAARGWCSVYFISATEWLVIGAVS